MVNIDVKSNKPIYEQITEQVKENIIKGYLNENDLLPSVRKLAVMLNVNPNTVAKAYQELERQNIIITIRGKGTFIAEFKKNEIKKDLILVTLKKIRPLIMELKYMGINDDDIIKEIKTICQEFERKEGVQNDWDYKSYKKLWWI